MELKIIQKRIYEIRGHKVMLDFDLAELYEVETRILNQAVKRNIKRFPVDFMFRLSEKEWESMRSQFDRIGKWQSDAITNCDGIKKEEKYFRCSLCFYRTRFSDVERSFKF